MKISNLFLLLPLLVLTTLAFNSSLYAENGKQLYQTYCAACHGLNGEGRKDAAPALAQSLWVNEDPNIIVQVMLHGLQGSLNVHGESFDLVMPAQTTLSDQQIADIASYVRKSWGNKAAVIEKTFVDQVKKETKNQNGVIHTRTLIKNYKIREKSFKIDNLLSASFPFTEDFDALSTQEPEAIEEEKKGLIHLSQINVLEKSFTGKWTGLISIKKAGDYHFSFATDQAARILVDDKIVLDRKPQTPPSIGSIRLPKGEVEITIYLAHKAKSHHLCRLFISGPNMVMHRMHDTPKTKKPPVIKINPTTERAIVHRNFFDKTGERILAVGFPQKVNFLFSTQNMRLINVWKGDFLNVGKTWQGRAKGQVATAIGKPLPLIEQGNVFKLFAKKPDSWNQAESEPVRSQFKSYSFDEHGNLIFNYQVGNYLFQDLYRVSSTTQSLIRNISIKPISNSPNTLYWKLTDKVKESKGPTLTTESNIQLHITSKEATPLLLKQGVVLPITKESTITLEYVW